MVGDFELVVYIYIELLCVGVDVIEGVVGEGCVGVVGVFVFDVVEVGVVDKCVEVVIF